MERIIKKLFLSGCLVLAVAVSLTALASSSASAVQKTSIFSVTVPKTISITSAAMAGTTDADRIITADPNNVVSKNLNIGIKSNAGFTISLHAASTNLTSGNNTIPASSSLTAGTSGWGIKKKPTANSTTDAGSYTGMTTSAVEFYRQTTAQTTAQTYAFPVGVAVSKIQAEGSYTTVVTVTAVNI